ncbi:MAG: hypothetical protein ACJ71I_00580 [Nitrososphaeraceae archaeon]|jgi:hypothetical protein
MNAILIQGVHFANAVNSKGESFVSRSQLSFHLTKVLRGILP